MDAISLLGYAAYACLAYLLIYLLYLLVRAAGSKGSEYKRTPYDKANIILKKDIFRTT